MVEPLPPRETVRVTIGGARQGSTRAQGGKTVLGPKGIEIERESRACEKDGRKSERKNTSAFHHGCTQVAEAVSVLPVWLAAKNPFGQ